MRSIFVCWGESGESQQKSRIPQKFKEGFPWCLTNEVVSSSEVFWQASDSLSKCFFIYFFNFIFFLRQTENQSAFSSAAQAVKGLYSQLGSFFHVLCPAPASPAHALTSENVWKSYVTLNGVLCCLKTPPAPPPPPPSTTPSVNNLFTSQDYNFLLHSVLNTSTIQFLVQKPCSSPEPYTPRCPLAETS